MKLLLDEMFPPLTAVLLREDHDLDAVHVNDVGLRGAEDRLVAQHARADDRAVVTENVADFAAEKDVVVVCVLKRNLPPGAAQAPGLARLLATWARKTPEPYVGQHWPH